MANDFLQALHTDFGEVLPHLLGKERKEVDDVLHLALEVLAKLRVLSGNTHRTGIGITLAHHHTTKDNQRQRTERELVSTQHCHNNHILSGLQLTVCLQSYLIPQPVHHQRLLRLSETNLGRDTCKAHR